MDLKEKLSWKQATGLILFSIAVLFLMVKISSTPDTSQQKPVRAETTSVKPQPKMESEDEYKASCLFVSGIDDGKNLYYKEFLKNPQKYSGTRLNMQAKIMSIEESGNRTAIQVYLSRNFDSGIVYYDGVMKIYQGDIIQIYGEGAGVLEGKNRMGASMTVPMIRAKYIKKERSGD